MKLAVNKMTKTKTYNFDKDYLILNEMSASYLYSEKPFCKGLRTVKSHTRCCLVKNKKRCTFSCPRDMDAQRLVYLALLCGDEDYRPDSMSYFLSAGYIAYKLFLYIVI